MHDLVHQMGTQVVDGAISRNIVRLPGIGGRIRAMAIEVRLEFSDPAESAVLDAFLEGQEIRIPPSVLIDREKDTLRFGQVRQFLCFDRCWREGLFDDNCNLISTRRLSEQQRVPPCFLACNANLASRRCESGAVVTMTTST